MLYTVDKPWWGLMIGVLCGLNIVACLTTRVWWLALINGVMASMMIMSFTRHWLPCYIARRVREQMIELTDLVDTETK